VGFVAAKETFSIPEGWTLDHVTVTRGEEAILTAPGVGYVTIVWHRRGFRPGISTIGKLIGKGPFRGRGWKQRLVNEAVAWLKEIETQIAQRTKR